MSHLKDQAASVTMRCTRPAARELTVEPFDLPNIARSGKSPFAENRRSRGNAVAIETVLGLEGPLALGRSAAVE